MITRVRVPRVRQVSQLLASLIGGLLVLATLMLPAAAQSAQSDRKVAVIAVEGMACVACAASVKSTVKSLDGVLNVEVSLAKRNATVTYRPSRLSAEGIAAAINKLGYKAGIPREVE